MFKGAGYHGSVTFSSTELTPEYTLNDPQPLPQISLFSIPDQTAISCLTPTMLTKPKEVP
jgi:hypothetical protein